MRIMFSGRHIYLDNLVIFCLCYLSYHQNLTGGRRLGPNRAFLVILIL